MSANDNNRANHLLQVVNRVREMNVARSGESSPSSSGTSSPPRNSPSTMKRRVEEDNHPPTPEGSEEGGCQPLDFSSKRVKKDDNTNVGDNEASQSISHQFQVGEHPQLFGNLSQHFQRQQQLQQALAHAHQQQIHQQAQQQQSENTSRESTLGSDGRTPPSSSENSPQRQITPEPTEQQSNSSNNPSTETSPINQEALRALAAAAAANSSRFPAIPPPSAGRAGEYQMQALQAAIQQQRLAAAAAAASGMAGGSGSCGLQAGMGGVPTGASPAIAVGSMAGALGSAPPQFTGADLLELSRVNSESQENFVAFREQMMQQIEAARPKGRRTSGTPGTPEDMKYKDPAYYERRKKNNGAAKRSRDARRSKENEIAVRAQFLEKENCDLRYRLAMLRAQIAEYEQNDDNTENDDNPAQPPPPPPSN